MSRDEGRVVVGLSGVSVDLGGHSVLHGIDFDVHQGGFVGIVGPNGAGKTTLLRTILGLVSAARGRVEVFGYPPGRNRPIITTSATVAGKLPAMLWRCGT